MGADDFRSNEQSVVIEADDTLRIELVGDDGETEVLKDGPGAGRRGRRRHRACGSRRCAEFLAEQIERAKADDVLFSVHLKATMMKVSDPIIFGHVVQAFFPQVFERVRRAARRRRPQPQQRARRDPRRPRRCPRTARRSRRRSRQGIADGPRAGDGRLRQGHHQPARARPT